jgi:nucleoid-associated protein YgaU
VVVVGVAAVLALRRTAPDPGLIGNLVDLQRWVERDGVDAVAAQLAGAVGWLALVWLSVGTLVVGVARLPGAVGRLADALARAVVPAAVRRLAAVLLGMALAATTAEAAAAAESFEGAPADGLRVDWPLAPAPGAAATADGLRVDWPLAAPPARGAAAPTDQPHVDWPLPPLSTVSTALATDDVHVDRPLAPAPSATAPADHIHVDWPPTPPRTPGTAATADSLHVDWPPAPGTAAVTGSVRVDWPISPSSAPRLRDGGATDRRLPGTPTAPERPRSVVVSPGDTLWSLAARRLGRRASPARIAAEWPRWYAANRASIGGDPARLLPGLRLDAPPSSDL